MRLPQKFVSKMQELLGDEWAKIVAEWKNQGHSGLRVNTLKLEPEEYYKKVPRGLERIPWTAEGFYFDADFRPAKHAYYNAGLYYIQEPSAMAPVSCMDIKPGERVLDLCAAPGGKTTQIAALLKGEGFLVSNDNNAARIRTLVWNIEHSGARNVVVFNEDPQRLSVIYPDYFDKILVDAPCSGEGMFRKDERAMKGWENFGPQRCTLIQKDILHSAAKMLCPGGSMIYSTCTFAPEENEMMIMEFLNENPEFILEDLPVFPGWDTGRPDWAANAEGARELLKTRRLWPHRIKGEGHFIARMCRKTTKTAKEYIHNKRENQKELTPWFEFMKENLNLKSTGNYILRGKYIYQMPYGFNYPEKLNIARPGWFVGMLNNGRFEPSQALAMGLAAAESQRFITLEVDDRAVQSYLKGETMLMQGDKGWTLVCVEEFPLGWGKQMAENLKNYYPPSWRNPE